MPKKMKVKYYAEDPKFREEYAKIKPTYKEGSVDDVTFKRTKVKPIQEKSVAPTKKVTKMKVKAPEKVASELQSYRDAYEEHTAKNMYTKQRLDPIANPEVPTSAAVSEQPVAKSKPMKVKAPVNKEQINKAIDKKAAEHKPTLFGFEYGDIDSAVAGGYKAVSKKYKAEQAAQEKKKKAYRESMKLKK